eukprot:1156711-Pelagomonas_calceolata.AAC.1
MQPCAPRSRDPFLTWAAPKLKELELLSMEVAAASALRAWGKQAAGSMQGENRANLSRGRVDGTQTQLPRGEG